MRENAINEQIKNIQQTIFSLFIQDNSAVTTVPDIRKILCNHNEYPPKLAWLQDEIKNNSQYLKFANDLKNNGLEIIESITSADKNEIWENFVLNGLPHTIVRFNEGSFNIFLRNAIRNFYINEQVKTVQLELFTAFISSINEFNEIINATINSRTTKELCANIINEINVGSSFQNQIINIRTLIAHAKSPEITNYLYEIIVNITGFKELRNTINYEVKNIISKELYSVFASDYSAKYYTDKFYYEKFSRAIIHYIEGDFTRVLYVATKNFCRDEKKSEIVSSLISKLVASIQFKYFIIIMRDFKEYLNVSNTAMLVNEIERTCGYNESTSINNFFNYIRNNSEHLLSCKESKVRKMYENPSFIHIIELIRSCIDNTISADTAISVDTAKWLYNKIISIPEFNKLCKTAAINAIRNKCISEDIMWKTFVENRLPYIFLLFKGSSEIQLKTTWSHTNLSSENNEHTENRFSENFSPTTAKVSFDDNLTNTVFIDCTFLQYFHSAVCHFCTERKEIMINTVNDSEAIMNEKLKELIRRCTEREMLHFLIDNFLDKRKSIIENKLIYHCSAFLDRFLQWDNYYTLLNKFHNKSFIDVSNSIEEEYFDYFNNNYGFMNNIKFEIQQKKQSSNGFLTTRNVRDKNTKKKKCVPILDLQDKSVKDSIRSRINDMNKAYADFVKDKQGMIRGLEKTLRESKR